MTEQELTALAEGIPEPHVNDFDTDEQLAWARDARALAVGYLTLKAERDALKEQIQAVLKDATVVVDENQALKERLALEQFKNYVPPTDQPTDDDVEVER